MVVSSLDFVLLVLASSGLACIGAGLVRIIFPGLEVERYLASAGVGFGVLPVIVVLVWTNAYRRRAAADTNARNAQAQVDWERAEALKQAAQQPQQAPQVAVPPQPDSDVARVAHWNVAAHRFIQAGARHGFGVRMLAGERSAHKVISWEGWGEMVQILADAGILVTGSRGTKFAVGWDFDRWTAERRGLRLTFPSHEPPEVAVTVYTTTSQHNTKPATVAE